jgi:hypothetical protein
MTSIVHSSIIDSLKELADGTFTATTEGVFDWGEGNIFKAQLGAGDSLSLAKVR